MNPKSNEYVLRVKGLLVSRGADLNAIAESLDEYITIIPELAESLISSLFANKIPIFLRNMETLISILHTANARWLATDAEALRKTAKRGDLDLCRKQLAPMITELYSLSIEMQMTQTRAAQEVVEKQSKLEQYTDVVNNLSAVEHLIAGDEHEKARDMLSDMAGIQHERLTVELLASLAGGELKKAAELAPVLKKQYIQMIVNHGGSASDFHRKILAVDDRADILTAVSQALRGHYKVLGAPRGKAALKMLESEHPDLFLLDIDMPEMNGYQLAEEIRKLERHKKTPLVFLTSNATREYVVRAMQAGADDFVIKPVNNNTLLAKISKYLP